MQRKRFIPAAAAVIVVLVSASFLTRTDDRSEFLEERAALVVRSVGHRLLLHAGDSGSRVLPVTQAGPGIFQLEFQQAFSFMPDTLVKIVENELAHAGLPLNYMVTVYDCATQHVVYGFEIRPEKRDIVPCLGRTQPRGCYSIRVAFVDFSDSDNSAGMYLVTSVAGIGLALFVFIGGRLRKKEAPARHVAAAAIRIGTYLFDSQGQVLQRGAEVTALSDKEAKLLTLFAARPDQLIERELLLKEVWENEGVFTGRSLDMFVSKLRKKLSGDPAVRIVNVHGRGYKLETGDR